MFHRIEVLAGAVLLVFAVAMAKAADENKQSGSGESKKAATAKSSEKKSPRRGSKELKAGDVAPDFELKTLDGKQTVKLSSFRGKRPVALIFGSYT